MTVCDFSGDVSESVADVDECSFWSEMSEFWITGQVLHLECEHLKVEWS